MSSFIFLPIVSLFLLPLKAWQLWLLEVQFCEYIDFHGKNQGFSFPRHIYSLCKDYRCADDRLELSARGVTILNSSSVSSSETDVRNWIKKSWKAHPFL
jgi:hypothetical protein